MPSCIILNYRSGVVFQQPLRESASQRSATAQCRATYSSKSLFGREVKESQEKRGLACLRLDIHIVAQRSIGVFFSSLRKKNGALSDCLRPPARQLTATIWLLPIATGAGCRC